MIVRSRHTGVIIGTAWLKWNIQEWELHTHGEMPAIGNVSFENAGNMEIQFLVVEELTDEIIEP